MKTNPDPKRKKKMTCPDCFGTKLDQMDNSMYCPFCNGKGWVYKSELKGTIFEK